MKVKRSAPTTGSAAPLETWRGGPSPAGAGLPVEPSRSAEECCGEPGEAASPPGPSVGTITGRGRLATRLHRNVGALGRSRVDLARPADLEGGIAPHLAPLGDP